MKSPNSGPRSSVMRSLKSSSLWMDGCNDVSKEEATIVRILSYIYSTIRDQVVMSTYTRHIDWVRAMSE